MVHCMLSRFSMSVIASGRRVLRVYIKWEANCCFWGFRHVFDCDCGLVLKIVGGGGYRLEGEGLWFLRESSFFWVKCCGALLRFEYRYGF